MTKEYIGDLILAEAKKWEGVREHGYNKGKEVEMFQKAVDGISQAESWCMAFVQYVALAVAKQISTVSGLPALNLKASLKASEHCLTVWNTTVAKYRKTQPGAGMIVIFQHGTSTSGHTGFTKGPANPKTQLFETIEGNTNKAGSREGDGVYSKARGMHTAGDLKLKGFIDLPQIIFDLLPDSVKIS